MIVHNAYNIALYVASEKTMFRSESASTRIARNRMSVRLNIIFGVQLFAGVQLVFDQQSKNESYKFTRCKRECSVITGEGRLDGQTVMGKAPIGVAKTAKKYGKPAIGFSGCVTKDAVACNREGIDAFFPILRGVVTLDEAMKTENAGANLADTAEQVFRLIRAMA